MRATVLVCLMLCLAGKVPSAQAATLQAYAFSQGGESTCGTFGPTSHMSNDYLDGPSGKLYQLTPAAGCGVQQIMDYSFGLAAQNATSAVTASGIASGGTFMGNSSAHAAFGVLGVKADGNYNGLIDPTSAIGSESFATFGDALKLPGPNGVSGLLVLNFTVSGSFDTSGGAGAEFEIDYRIGSGPALMLYRIMAVDSPPTLYYQGFVSSLPGLTVGPNSVTGTANITLGVPFTYNVPSPLTLAVFAGETPSSNHGLGGGSAAHVDFGSTTTLTGITALVGGQPVAFTIQSDSGTVYTAAGVQAPSQVPEPADFGLLCAGLAVLAAVARRRVS
jgi:hypothetical protein